MTVEKMKEKIKSVYPYETWYNKVNSMENDQIQAIYFKFRDLGKFDRRQVRERKKKAKEASKYHQMTIAEYMEEK